jgi:replicative DNA helicase
MGRSASPNTLRRLAITELEAAITLAKAAGEYQLVARYANQLAGIARQLEVSMIAASLSRASRAVNKAGSTEVPTVTPSVIIE